MDKEVLLPVRIRRDRRPIGAAAGTELFIRGLRAANRRGHALAHTRWDARAEEAGEPYISPLRYFARRARTLWVARLAIKVVSLEVGLLVRI